MQLENRVALVTGAARRVGRAIVTRLADAGCHIALHYHRSDDEAEQTARECRQAGVRVELFRADLADPAAATNLPAQSLDAFGRLDILINNASHFPQQKLEDFTLADWSKTLAINLTAPMLLAHAAREPLRRSRGCVVNLCDVSTSRPWPDHLAYSVSKGGLDTLTKVLARAMAPEVRVVGVAPGVAVWPEHYPQSLRNQLLERVPLQRAGEPEDIAAAVHYLLTAGDYVTGTILPVDGGRHIV